MLKMISSLLIIATLALGGASLQAANELRLEQQYSVTLAALRVEIVQALPKLDAQMLADFWQAYAAEGAAQSAYEASLKGKAHIGSPAAKTKEEEAKVGKAIADAYANAQANTIAAAKPILTELEKLLSSDTLDLRLVKCAALANATPRGLAEFAQRGKSEETLVAKLLADDALLKQMLMAGGAKGGNYGRAMQIYSEIQQGSNKAGEGILQRLALGTSLEQTVQGGKGGVFDPVKRYLGYEKAYLNGELDPAFKSMTAWECRMITDAPESDEDLAWCREMLRNYRPDHIFNPDYRWRYSRLVRTDVPYQHPDPPGNDGTSRIQQLLAGGGQCGPRAFVGRFALRAFGIPVWGVTQPGHAALAHWTPAGWTINLGADWKFSWWEDRPGSDFHLESQARTYPDDFIKVLRAQWIGDAMGEPKVNPKQPGSGGLWNALALTLERAIVAEKKPAAVAVVGEDLAEATESKFNRAEAVIAAKITEADRKIIIDQTGVITIPAAACSKPQNNTKNIDFMKSFAGGMQMSCHQDEAFEYVVNVPAAGKYALTARVVTVHKGQHLLLLPNAAATPIDIAMPYTFGLWEETTPAKIALVKGKNTLRFISRVPNYGMTIKQFTLVPVK